MFHYDPLHLFFFFFWLLSRCLGLHLHAMSREIPESLPGHMLKALRSQGRHAAAPSLPSPPSAHVALS